MQVSVPPKRCHASARRRRPKLHMKTHATAVSIAPESLTNACGTLFSLNDDIWDSVGVDDFIRPDEDVVIPEELTDELL